MTENLKIIHYPDPRLKKRNRPVEAFDQPLRELAGQMLELMKQARGVGLAAPQVARNIRLFVMNPTGEPADSRVYVNPVLSDPEGEAEAEEGCLSLPEINAQIVRSKKLIIRARNLEGTPIEEAAEGIIARIWQHECDHLNGVLILDRMGPSARLANRKKIKELEERYAAEKKAIGALAAK